MKKLLLIALLIVGCGTIEPDVDSCINPDEIYACDIFQEYTDFETIFGMNPYGVPTGIIGDGIYWGGSNGYSEEMGEGNIPVNFVCYHAYPNPFNSEVLIKVAVPNDGLLDLFIVKPNYDRVATLINDNVNTADYHIAQWDGSDSPDGYYRAIAVFGEWKCFKNLHKSP